MRFIKHIGKTETYGRRAADVAVTRVTLVTLDATGIVDLANTRSVRRDRRALSAGRVGVDLAAKSERRVVISLRNAPTKREQP